MRTVRQTDKRTCKIHYNSLCKFQQSKLFRIIQSISELYEHPTLTVGDQGLGEGLGVGRCPPVMDIIIIIPRAPVVWLQTPEGEHTPNLMVWSRAARLMLSCNLIIHSELI